MHCSLCVPTVDHMRCNTRHRGLQGAHQFSSAADSEPATSFLNVGSPEGAGHMLNGRKWPHGDRCGVSARPPRYTSFCSAISNAPITRGFT